MKYQPKRSSKRWLEGAPEPVLACYDSGPSTCDRYMVLYGAPFWDPEMGRNVPYVSMSADPFWPLGFCQHGEAPSINRPYFGKKIKWNDLPLDCRKAVEQDCKEDT